jgi:hypothetical protein
MPVISYSEGLLLKASLTNSSQNAILKIPKAKKGWWSSSGGREPVLQA